MTDPRNIARRLEQTQVVERSGGVTGYDIFYQTSTYTPTYLGGTTAGVTTYTTQQGTWTRIGQVAIVCGTVAWTAATGTGAAIISLPFTAQATANQNFAGSVWIANVTFANSTPLLLILPSGTTFSLYSPLTNAGNTVVNVEAAGTIIFTVTYFIQ